MATITITEKKKLKTTSEEIQEQFPNLFVVFLEEESLSSDYTIASYW